MNCKAYSPVICRNYWVNPIQWKRIYYKYQC